MSAEERPSRLPEDRLWQPVTIQWFVVVLGACLIYAIIRYHFAEGVAWSHFPLFVLNKATSLAAVIFVACSYLIGRVIPWHNDAPKIKLVVIKFCGLTGFSLAFMHAFFSVCILNPAYFSKFFEQDGRLNLTGELGLAVGVIALWALAIPAITTLPMMAKALGGIRWKRTQRMGYLCLLFVLAHMVVFGWRGWRNPSGWPWGMPPITSLAALTALIPIVIRIRVFRQKGK